MCLKTLVIEISRNGNATTPKNKKMLQLIFLYQNGHNLLIFTFNFKDTCLIRWTQFNPKICSPNSRDMGDPKIRPEKIGIEASKPENLGFR
jgi:hypothetical protein